jgi:hypothetical protein
MDEFPSFHNSDFAYYQNMLQSERKWTRRGGLAQIIIGAVIGAMGVVGIVMFIIFLSTLHIPPLQVGSVLVFFVLLVFIAVVCPLALISSSLKTLHKGKQPVTHEEVEARRQAERAILFNRARGKLPVEYTPRGHRSALLLGGGMVIFFVLVLVAFWGQPFPLSLVGRFLGIGGIFAGLLQMLLPFVYNQRAANRLQHQSAQILRQGIVVEEQADLDDEASSDPG